MQVIFQKLRRMIWLIFVENLLQNFISERWKWINFFSIEADEVSDCSNQKQLSLVIRYADSDFVIRKEFLDFLHCDLQLWDKVLAQTTSGELINLGLNIINCRGQGYDKAAAVSEHINGLSARIYKISSKAISTALC